MRRRRAGVLTGVLIAATLLAPSAFAEMMDCAPGEELEVVTYDWKLKGFLSFIAGLRFPTRGTGTLATLYRTGEKTGETELRIIADDAKGDRYRYRSLIDLEKNRTMESVDGYHFSGRTRSDTTTFDYENGKARRVRIDTKKGKGETVRFVDFAQANVKDVLTSIHHIRQTAESITSPERHGVFAGGKVYEVLITPGTTKTIFFKGRKLEARLFTITATPEDRDRWPGDVEVWITTDDEQIPLVIDLGKSMASLRLEAVSRFTCP
jgi:hypothetical protein